MMLINDNGGWCWYQDDKVIYDPVAGNIITSTAANGTGFGGVSGTRSNDMDSTTLNIDTGKRTRFDAHEGFGGDDHNMGAFWIRPDGRYLHIYCQHYNDPQVTYLRLATNPHDGSAWGSEYTYNWETISGLTDTQSSSYTNVYYLTGEGTGQGRLYNIIRVFTRTPCISYSDDMGQTWQYMGQLNSPAGGATYSNFYHKFRGNGVDRIDFIGVENHPRDNDNSVYHGYIKNGKSYNSYGTIIDNDLYDQSAPSIQAFTPIFIADTEPLDADSYHTGWTNEMELDKDGYPVCLYQTRHGITPWGNNSGSWGNIGAADHRFFYARFDGSTWTSTELCKLGGGLHLPEQDYTGMGCIHPNDANIVYVATQFDPRDDTEYEYREIFKGVTYDKGLTWNWTQITFNSTQNNTRPAIPPWDANNTAVVWTRGNWNQDNYEQYDLVVVGTVEEQNTSLGLVSYIDASTGNTTNADGSAFNPTGPSGSAGSADSRWHEYTGYGNGGSCYTAGDGGTENVPTIKTTITGLSGGTYDVFAYFWCDPNLDWGIRGGFTSAVDDMLCFSRQSAQFAEASQFSSSVTVTTPGYQLYRVYIGRKEISGGGSVVVYLDNYDSTYNSNAPTRTTYDGIGVAAVSYVEDITPPEPDPMTWSTMPTATGPTTITMTATTATDDSPPVQYYFECTTDGSKTSGWQTSPTYVASGLTPSTEYSFRIKARDSSPTQNETGWSTEESEITNPSDTTPPTPNPMTWATVPTATGQTTITMTATTATDAESPPVQYYFECTTDGSKTSGWQSSSTYIASGLTPSTLYSFRVKARDSAAALNETGWSSIQSATTEEAPTEVQILGSWVTGTSHTKETGSNRVLVVIGHAEGSSGSNPVLSAVTYGGQTMTKVADKTQTWDATSRAYVAIFILNEAGVAAASSSTISATWSGTSSNSLTSVFLSNVDQTNIIGDFAVNGVRAAATIATSALATSSGDMVIAGVTCTGTGSYTPNNGFTEGVESPISSADGCADYKSSTGAAETPSVTHSTSTNHQAMVSFVVQATPDSDKVSHPNPGNGISGVTVATGLSWDAPAGYTPTSYYVYFGTNPAVRSNPRYTVYTASYTPPEYLTAETTYYWAVDSNDAGTVYPGDSWNFTTYVPIDGDLVANYVISLSLPGTTYYADICAYYGVLVYSELTGNTAMRDSAIAKYPTNYYNGSQTPGTGVDLNVYGIYPFEMYRQTGDANYLTVALYLADDSFNPPTTDGLGKHSRFWVDDTYMIGSLQAQAYKSMDDIVYANRAVTQLLGYMGEVENLQQANGLFYHTLSALFHWGRGNGWAAAAMTEVLLAIPQDHPQRAQLLSKYQAMMDGLVTYQGENGMWYQVLNMGSDPRNWYESSCSGMYVFALATGVRKGWLPEQPYKKAAFDGWAGLSNFVDSQGRALQVCTGTGAGTTLQYYFDRPREIGNTHAEAGILWAATAMEYLLGEIDITPPAAPTGLSATDGNGLVSLDWNDNTEDDLDGYNVYRSTTSGSGYSQINGTLLSSSDYIDNSVTNGITYYYVVTAVDTNSNESEDSNEVSATPFGPPDTTPPTPDPMTWASYPTATGSSTITMTATTATDSESPPVQYYFECTTDGSKTSGWQSSSTYIASGLTPSTLYSFRVKARDSYTTPNETGWSSTLSATTEVPPSNIEILGSWVTGTSHTKESGYNRALIFIAHGEMDGTMNLTGVTYGGQAMTKVVERDYRATIDAYVVAYILDADGIAAATNSTFVPTWSATPAEIKYASVFLANVNQSTLTGASATAGGTSATISTSALATSDGDMVIDAATCGNTGTYTMNNGFTLGVNQSSDSSTGGTGYKSATGANETPSVTHNSVNRQALIGFVVKASSGGPVMQTLTVSSTSGGTVTTPGIGDFDYTNGTNASIVASANTNYHFVNWTGTSVTAGKVANPTSASTTVTMDSDYTVVANFAIDTFTLNYAAGTGGSLTGDTSQVVDYGEDGTAVTAVPDTGYHFVNWSDASTENPRTDLNVTANISVTANFAIDTFTLNYAAGVGGSITGDTSQVVDYGEDGTAVTAVPDTGYHFVNWSDASTENPRTDLNVTANISVTANFAIDQHTLTSSSTEGGSVTTPGEGAFDYDYGTVVNIIATDDTGYHFINWTGTAVTAGKVANPTSANTTVTMDGDYTIIANFAEDTIIWTLTISSTANGSVTMPGEGNFDYDEGTYASIEAVADLNYHFTDWTGTAVTAGKVTSPTSASTTVLMDASYTVIANFAIDTFTLNYAAGTGGSLTGDTSQVVDYGEDGTAVTAVPDTGYHFVNWSDASTENPRTDLNVTANISVTANFAIDTFTLNYAAGAGGSLTGDTSQVVDYGEDGTAVTAVPDTGYHFVNWSDASTDNPRTDLNVTANVNVTANFAIDQHTLTSSSTTGGSVTTPGEGAFDYDYGTYTSIVATPDTDYHFVNWTGTAVTAGKVADPCAASTTVLMDSDYTVIANFEADIVDETPPTPNPMTWALTPTATGSTTIAMTATSATDSESPPVEYYFECTNDGSKSSGWQTSTTYVASGLTPSTLYSFRVRARDSAATPNVTGFSSTESATTNIGTGQTPYPGPDLHAIPGRIEAENYDNDGEGVAYHDLTSGNEGGEYRTDDVDIETCSEGNYNIGWLESGEWLEYSVIVATTGTYDIEARVGSQNTGGSFHLEFDGNDVTGTVSIPSTGAWQTYTSIYINNVSLTAGAHIMRLSIDSSWWNVTWFDFAPTADTTPPAPPTGLASTAGNNTVSLDWNNNSEPDLAGYNLYRSTTSGSGYIKLNATLLSTSDYVDDTAINGTTYYYVATAVDTNDNESGNSTEATAMPWYQTCAELQAGGAGLESDLNGDCYVNYKDLEVIANYWLSSCIEPDNCGGADFGPADGVVDLLDYGSFAVQWLECNDPEDPNCG
jgi:rhamnogalacturonyl hydrolase YesR